MICRESGCSLSNSHDVYLSLISGCGCWLQNAKARMTREPPSFQPGGQNRTALPGLEARGRQGAGRAWRGRLLETWVLPITFHLKGKTRLMAILRLAASQPRLGRQFPL